MNNLSSNDYRIDNINVAYFNEYDIMPKKSPLSESSINYLIKNGCDISQHYDLLVDEFKFLEMLDEIIKCLMELDNGINTNNDVIIEKMFNFVITEYENNEWNKIISLFETIHIDIIPYFNSLKHKMYSTIVSCPIINKTFDLYNNTVNNYSEDDSNKLNIEHISIEESKKFMTIKPPVKGLKN